MNRGKFIAIEGLDGSGSTTQIAMVVDYLRARGISALSTKEPTDNVIGGLIRGALTGVYKLPDVSLQFLFSADRGHHLSRLVEPVLQNGRWVVCDRYIWSTIAFGSLALDKSWLCEMQKYFRVPDLSIFVEVSPKECVRRIKEDRFDVELFEEEKKLRKVWATYRWLAARYPKQIKIVDGNRQKEEVFKNIAYYINKLLEIKSNEQK